MTTINSDDDFAQAVEYLINAGQLSVQGERYLDLSNRKVWDQRGDTSPNAPTGKKQNFDITPSAAVLQSALDLAQAQAGATEQRMALRAAALAELRGALMAARLQQVADDNTAIAADFDTLTGLSGVLLTAIALKPILLRVLARQKRIEDNLTTLIKIASQG